MRKVAVTGIFAIENPEFYKELMKTQKIDTSPELCGLDATIIILDDIEEENE